MEIEMPNLLSINKVKPLSPRRLSINVTVILLTIKCADGSCPHRGSHMGSRWKKGIFFLFSFGNLYT